MPGNRGGDVGSNASYTRKLFLYLASLGGLIGCVYSQQAVITTVAGTDLLFSGDGKPARQAPLGGLDEVLLDGQGNVFVADEDNNLVVKITPDGILHVVAGNGLFGNSGDNG